MPAPTLGLILTHTESPQTLRSALALMRADLLKVVPAWGLAGGWTPAAIADAANQTAALIVRTSWGDPSYGDGARALPDPRAILDELAPWLRARPDAAIEIGNEPRQAAPGRRPPDLDAYARDLADAVTACRAMFPRARLIAPAHSLHDPAQDGEVARWLTACGPAYRACDAVAIHAYTADQLIRGMSLVRARVGGQPVWLTEVNLGEDMGEAERGRRLWALLREAPVAVAAVYHLDQGAGAPTEAQGPGRYRLSPATLAELGRRDAGLAAPAPAGPAAPAVGVAAAVGGVAVRDVRAQLSVIRGRVPRPRQGPPASATLHYNGPAVAAHGSPAGELRHIVQIDTPWHQRNPKVLGDSLQYHWCVLSDGTILQTRDPVLPASHCAHATGNRESLAVHLPLGGTQDATPEQWAATCRLLDELIAVYRWPGRQAIRGHDEWSETLCPGPQLRRRLLAWRAGAAPVGGLYRIRGDIAAANVREGPGRDFPVALGGRARMWPGDVLDADALVAGEAIGGDATWLHRRDGVGFVHRSLVEGV